MALYFAYGSGLSREQMSHRCPDARPAFRAALPDHRLDFTHYSVKRGGGTADIVPAPGGVVWGGVYEVSDSDLISLDRFEDCPYYQRTELIVRRDGAEQVTCWAYSVVRKRGPFEASEGHLALIQEGAAEWELPEDYQELLHQFEAEHDHDHD